MSRLDEKTLALMLPCPFCSSKNLSFLVLAEESECVTCDTCNAQGGYYLGNESTTPQEAIEFWNKRYSLASWKRKREAELAKFQPTESQIYEAVRLASNQFGDVDVHRLVKELRAPAATALNLKIAEMKDGS